MIMLCYEPQLRITEKLSNRHKCHEFQGDTGRCFVYISLALCKKKKKKKKLASAATVFASLFILICEITANLMCHYQNSDVKCRKRKEELPWAAKMMLSMLQSPLASKNALELQMMVLCKPVTGVCVRNNWKDTEEKGSHMMRCCLWDQSHTGH